jgi:hypothetical protein
MATAQAPETEAEVARRGFSILEERLPAGWSAELTTRPDRPNDGTIEIRDETGASSTLILEVKRIVKGRDVGPLRDQLDMSTQELAGTLGLVVARYLSPPVRAKLTEAGLSYIDATGNVRVELTRPGLFLSDRGADQDPWRGPGRPLGTLKGEPAAKVVRTIADFARNWTVRELTDVSKASTGATYRVVEFLEREGLAMRGDDGRIAVPDWAQMLRRWSDDYGFVRTNQVTRWIAPRGLPGLREVLSSGDGRPRHAVTGTIAAAEWAPYAPARLAMIYVADASAAAEAWDLRPTEAEANVMLAVPRYDVVFERSSMTTDGITIAATSQVVVDLLTGPGRNPNEAEELLRWMQRDESAWRA